MKVLASLVLIVMAYFSGFFFNQSAICRAAGQKSETVSPQEFSRRLSTCHPVVLDVRTASEFSSGHISGALNSDFNQTAEFTSYLDTLDKNQTYFIYCRTGKRSATAMKLMTDKGFKSVINLDGGITAWTASGLPTIK